jgi:hypothetical protein
MRRLTESLVLSSAVLIVGCLATGCGQSGGGATANVAPSRSAALPSRSAALPSGTAALPSGTAALPGSSAALPSSIPATATIQPSPTQTAAATPAPTQTAATPAPAAQPSITPTPSSGSSSVIWLWVLLGAVVLIGVIIWITRASGRRSAAAAGWRSRVIDAYAKGSALHDAMSVAETPDARAAWDTGARWSDIRRRADDLTQTLYALREAAPDENERARVTDVLTSLQAVLSAMDAERAPGGAGARQAEVVRGRLSSFEASLRALRAPDERLP